MHTPEVSRRRVPLGVPTRLSSEMTTRHVYFQGLTCYRRVSMIWYTIVCMSVQETGRSVSLSCREGQSMECQRTFSHWRACFVRERYTLSGGLSCSRRLFF